MRYLKTNSKRVSMSSAYKLIKIKDSSSFHSIRFMINTRSMSMITMIRSIRFYLLSKKRLSEQHLIALSNNIVTGPPASSMSECIRLP